MIGVDRKRLRSRNPRRARIGMGEHEPRHAVGERRFADACGAADEPSVGQASASISVEQRALGLAMAVEDGGPARGDQLTVIGGAHDPTPAECIGAVAGSSRSVTVFQTRSATACLGWVASTTTQRPGSAMKSWR